MLQHQIRRFVAAMLAAGLLLPVAGGAEEAEPDTEVTPQQQAQQLVQKYRETAQKLQQIRQEAVAVNPGLEKQSQTFEDQIEEAMNEGGYDVDAGQEKLREMGDRYNKEDLSEEERRKLAGDFQSERQKMEQARQQVMQQEEIRTAGQELQQHILIAMQEQNPQTDELFQRLRKLRQKLQAMQSSGDGPAANQDDG
jgi:uncharacterized coiled-coil DUF342 family protein